MANRRPREVVEAEIKKRETSLAYWRKRLHKVERLLAIAREEDKPQSAKHLEQLGAWLSRTRVLESQLTTLRCELKRLGDFQVAVFPETGSHMNGVAKR